MTTIIVAVVAVVASLLIAVPITLVKFLWITKLRKDAETIGPLKKRPGIIDEALKA